MMSNALHSLLAICFEGGLAVICKRALVGSGICGLVSSVDSPIAIHDYLACDKWLRIVHGGLTQKSAST
jgi:uncharacterized protein GlcG (DUF336 family)